MDNVQVFGVWEEATLTLLIIYFLFTLGPRVNKNITFVYNINISYVVDAL